MTKLKEKQWLALMGAVDGAHAFLYRRFAPELAVAVTVRTEWHFATLWDAEQFIRRQLKDPREVFQIYREDIDELKSRISYIADWESDLDAERHLREMFSKLEPDAAWWAAHKVSREFWGELRPRKHWETR